MGDDYEPVEGNKQQKYEHVLQELQYRTDESHHPISNISNAIALLKAQFNWYWVGYYLVSKDILVLGPFQGPPACSKIMKGHGVCGKCWENQKTLIVEDVEKFQGHIACSSKSKSQIVVPVHNDNKIVGVLDVDSEEVGKFTEEDSFYLEKIMKILGDMHQFDGIV